MSERHPDRPFDWRGPSVSLVVAAVIALAVLATGVTMFSRGLFQDDAQVMFRVFTNPNGLFDAITMPITSPTRRLQGSVHALALLSGQPLLFLRLASEVIACSIGLMAAALAHYALRLSPVAVFVAGALAVTASSDWLTASVVALGYQQAVLLHFGGAFLLVRWTQTGRPARLVAAVIAGTASLWTNDAAALLHLGTPLLALMAADAAGARRRALWGGVLWVGLAVPYFVLLVGFLIEPRAYAAQAIVTVGWLDALQRWAELVAFNFTPWRWAFDRPVWYPAPTPTLSWPLRVALTGVGLSLTLWMLRKFQSACATHGGSRSDAGWVALRTVTLLLAFTVIANGMFVALHLSEVNYRTHLMSRVWASLALATTVGFLANSPSAGTRALATGLVCFFVTLGLVGGLERQNYFAGYARRHVMELRPIVDALPEDRDTYLLLRLPPHDMYAATEAPYLARAWVTLLGADPSLACRTFLLSTARGTRCEARPSGLVCGGDPTSICSGPGTWAVDVPYHRVIVLTYDLVDGAYHLDRDLPSELAPDEPYGGAARLSYAQASGRARSSPSWLASNLLGLSRIAE